jgi:hypothetical protein
MDFATPPRGGKEALISAAEKQSMLDNLDLEGMYRISINSHSRTSTDLFTWKNSQ